MVAKLSTSLIAHLSCFLFRVSVPTSRKPLLHQHVLDLLDTLLLLIVAADQRLVVLLGNMPGPARLFGELLLLTCQVAELPVQVCKLPRHILLERGHLFRELLLLLRDAGEIQRTPVGRDPGVRVKNRGQCCQVGEAHLSRLFVNAHTHGIDRQHPLGDPGPHRRYLAARDPASIGDRDPAITWASEFGHVYFFLDWVFWHGFTPISYKSFPTNSKLSRFVSYLYYQLLV